MSHRNTPVRRSFSHHDVACNGKSLKDSIGGMNYDVSQDSAGSDQPVIDFIHPFSGFKQATKSASASSFREDHRSSVYMSPSANMATNTFQTNEKLITLANDMLQIKIRIPLYLEDFFKDSTWKVTEGTPVPFVTCPIADAIVSHVVVQPVIKIKDLEEFQFHNMMEKRYAGSWSERTNGTFPNIDDLDDFINQSGNTPAALRPTASMTCLTESSNEDIVGKTIEAHVTPPPYSPAQDEPLSSGPDSPTLINMKIEKHLLTPVASPDAFNVYQRTGVVAGPSSSAGSVKQNPGSPTSVQDSRHPATVSPPAVKAQPSKVSIKESDARKVTPGVSTRSRIIRKAPRNRGRGNRSTGNARNKPALPYGLAPHDPDLGSKMIIVGGNTPEDAPRQVRRSVRNRKKPSEGRWSTLA